mmetsp:Transcript_67280/g.122753  ORF Transcript_67280/g.122753 Transcript_67280/m.122753 type:complete len:234 (+) Transcript_67280:120-821(+)
MPKRLDVPGPGAYKVPSGFGGKPGSRGCSFHGTGNAKAGEVVPGPGEYATQDVTVSRSAARCLFGSSNRFREHADDKPGPCDYTPSDPTVTSPRRTIGSRGRNKGTFDEETKSNLTPGPGAYSPYKAPTTPRAVTPGTNFAKGGTRSTGLSPRWVGRSGAFGLESPGPAAYSGERRGLSSTSKRQPSASFGTTPRLINHYPRAHSSPGPGTYSWNLKPYGPRHSMMPRRDESI